METIFIKGLTIVFIKSDSMSVQGKLSEIQRRYGKEWTIREQGNGNGNWLLTKKSDILINGESCRHFVLEYYDRIKLTESLVKKFCDDIENGKIKIEDIILFNERL